MLAILFGSNLVARGVEFSHPKNEVHKYWSADVCWFFYLALCELERHLRTKKTLKSVKMRFLNFGLSNRFVSTIVEP